jgi:hypothetical protein
MDMKNAWEAESLVLYLWLEVRVQERRDERSDSCFSFGHQGILLRYDTQEKQQICWEVEKMQEDMLKLA